MDIEIEKLKLERRKFRFTVFVAISTISGFFLQRHFESKRQQEQWAFEYQKQQTQFELQKEMQSQQFETSLINNTINTNDSLKGLRKLLQTGLISDDDKKFAFLLQDTVVIKSFRNGDYEATPNPKWKNISKWGRYHHKGSCDADMKNFKIEIASDGAARFIFNITPTRTIKNFIVKLEFCNENGKCYYSFDCRKLTIPFSKVGVNKTVQYEFCSKDIQTNFDSINKVWTKWECE